MKTYNVKIMDDALDDMFAIKYYINNTLKEPKIADEHIDAFLNGIDSLTYSANAYELLDENMVGKDNIRKINVKNYMIFYSTDEINCIVQVIAVFYGMSNWQTKIKKRILY